MRRYMRKDRVEPKVAIRIEFEDADYTNISSEYNYRTLQKDIESVKLPITIIWNSDSTAHS
jgi:hypothetical protein